MCLRSLWLAIGGLSICLVAAFKDQRCCLSAGSVTVVVPVVVDIHSLIMTYLILNVAYMISCTLFLRDVNISDLKECLQDA
jgi:hypothetical protein